MFTRFPQTTHVFFGGAHDNGYTLTLNYLQNEGFFHKLIILRGYKDFAPELRSLNLPYLEIEGLFLKDKLPSNNYKKPNASVPSSRDTNHTVQPQDFDKFRTKSATPQGQPSTKKSRKLIPNLVSYFVLLTMSCCMGSPRCLSLCLNVCSLPIYVSGR